MNVITHEDRKLTVQLSSLGFCIAFDGKHNTVGKTLDLESHEQIVEGEVNEVKDPIYFETPYALLSSVSEGYDRSFSENLISKLNQIQN